MSKHNFGPRLIDWLEKTKIAYVPNFLVLAYLVDITLSGFVYLGVNLKNLSYASPYSFAASLINLHTGKDVFGVPSTTGALGNHVLILLFIGVMAFMMVKIKCGRILAWQNLSSLRSGYVLAGLFIAFVIAIHELTWYFFYALFRMPLSNDILASPMFFVGITVLIGTFFMRKFTKNDGIFFSLMFIYYCLWALIGFHVTVDFSGVTQYMTNVAVNLTEDLSWLVMLPIIIVSYGRKLTGAKSESV